MQFHQPLENSKVGQLDGYLSIFYEVVHFDPLSTGLLFLDISYVVVAVGAVDNVDNLFFKKGVQGRSLLNFSTRACG